jgi:glycosyltransferase involved in cell wall biosynthesis
MKNSELNLSPDLSLVMPCYNEEEAIVYTIPRLVEAFQTARCRLQLIAVDNGSKDRTSDIIRELARGYPGIVYHRVEVNEGYGKGVLSGLPLCDAPWIGIIPADGQVDAEDVVRLYQATAAAGNWTLGKVRRRFRLDGVWRKLVSISYNLYARALWPSLGSLDLNGTPKIARAGVLRQMDLQSADWLLDPELMIKAHYMGIKILELNVFARMRSAGVSHVNPRACWQFFRSLLLFRFSGRFSQWKRTHQAAHVSLSK